MNESFGVIGVLMGGPSVERAISLKSGEAVVQALAGRGHRVVPVVLAPTDTTPERVAMRLQETGCDVAFVALHGTFGEDGTLQDILERLGIPFTGSGSEASRLAFDKWESRLRCAACDVPVARGAHVTRREAEALRNQCSRLHRQQWDGALVVKPVHQGSSMGVSFATSPAALSDAIGTALQFDDDILLEQCVRGRELTVAIFDEQALPVIEIRTPETFFNFQAKYHAASTEYLVPAPLKETEALRVQQVALTAHRALGLRHFSRVDLILAEDGIPYVLEVNAIPGLTARSLLPRAAQACGCGFPELCEHMVAMALDARTATMSKAA